VGRSLVQGEQGRRGETFELVVFSSYDVEDRAPYLGETLDHATVEALIRQKEQRSDYQKWYGCYGPKK